MSASQNRREDDAVLNGQETDPDEVSDDVAIVKNLGLVQRFVNAVFADPSLLDDVSEEINVVLIPTDDPELAEINLQGGIAMRNAGKPVRFVYV